MGFIGPGCSLIDTVGTGTGTGTGTGDKRWTWLATVFWAVSVVLVILAVSVASKRKWKHAIISGIFGLALLVAGCLVWKFALENKTFAFK